MSRAFVREVDEVGPEAPPELLVSRHPNLVTARGLTLIREKISGLERSIEGEPDAALKARLLRDLRYWSSRAESAHLVPCREADGVAFGSRVTFRRDGKEQQIIEIVGEDESDPAAGRISWVAPLAAAMLGARPGETVWLESRRQPMESMELTILAVENEPVRVGA